MNSVGVKVTGPVALVAAQSAVEKHTREKAVCPAGRQLAPRAHLYCCRGLHLEGNR